MKKLINYLYEPIKKNKKIITFELVIFIIGLVFGSFFITFISKGDKNQLINQLTNYMSNIKNLSKSVFGISAFKDIFINNIVQLILIFVLGISMIGLIAIIFILFFKGFTLGVTLSSMFLKYKLKGIICIFIYIVPVSILNILIYLLISFYAIYASSKFIKSLIKKDNLNFKTFFGKYLLCFIISIILAVILSLLESYLLPLVMKIFIKLL